MQSKRLFLQWALVVSLISVGFIIVAALGGISETWSLDQTKISFMIMGLFAVASCWCGYLCWRIDAALDAKRLQDQRDQAEELRPTSGAKTARRPQQRFKFDGVIKETSNQAEHGWLASSWCEKLGLLGTVVGFILMLIHGFIGFAPSNQAAIQQMLDHLGHGMSTAFITTLVGYVCSMLVELQYHMLTNALERLRR